MIPKTYQKILSSVAQDKDALSKAMARYVEKNKWDDEVQKLMEKAFPGCYQETEWIGGSRAWSVEDKGDVLILHRGAQAGRRNGNTKTRFFSIELISEFDSLESASVSVGTVYKGRNGS